MSQAFFAPNPNMTGGAVLVSFNSKEANVYFKIAKQVNNNPDKKNFDFKTAINVKLSADEAAGIVRAIRTGDKFKFYHQAQDFPATSGSYAFYAIDQGAGKEPRTGFGLKVKKEDKEYKVGFTEDTAERLKLYLEFALDHIFTADYSEDKARAAEYFKNKENGQTDSSSTTDKAPVTKNINKPAQSGKSTAKQAAKAPVSQSEGEITGDDPFDDILPDSQHSGDSEDGF